MNVTTLLNPNDTIGQIIYQATVNNTGDMFMTLLVIFLIFLALGLMFQIPIEFVSVLLVPLIIGLILVDMAFAVLLVPAIFILAMFFVRRSIFE